MTIDRRTLVLACGVAALPGCAALNTLSCEVATYGDWPAERKPGRYAFERLPSQKAGEAAKRQDLELVLDEGLRRRRSRRMT